ncbi:MAG: M20/M25/M40 family metallo-hydrolase [Sphingomonadales bacterium]
MNKPSFKIAGLLASVTGAMFFTNLTMAQEIKVSSGNASKFEAVLNNPKVQAAMSQIKADTNETLAEHIRLTEIEAPFFLEQKRAEYYVEQLKKRGLKDAYIDDEGNAIGIRKGTGNGPTLLIAAHLDTVFPAGTDVTVKLRDGKHYAPGIGDATRDLASLLAIIDAVNEMGIETEGDIIFSGNVGEEGLGDLRGVKALFRDHPEIDGFISMDGTNPNRIVRGGTGSHRYEVHFQGPGGHSFGAFGLASAIHAMGRAIAKISEVRTPSDPKTTFTVGTIRGGTSVNSIAADGWFQIDMRSNSVEELDKVDAVIRGLAAEAVAEENARWNNGEITVEFKMIGDRPVGFTPVTSDIVQIAFSAIEGTEGEFRGFSQSSTDSNVPMSMGIPAITIGGGGEGHDAHAPEEYYIHTADAYRGPQRAMLMMLSLVGVKGVSKPVLKDRNIS